jgi:hypothetical protein
MNFIRYNFFKKSKVPYKLGRWNIGEPVAVIQKKADWANHDHCGSELCEQYFEKKDNEKETNVKSLSQLGYDDFYPYVL